MSMKIFDASLSFCAPLFTTDIGIGTPATKTTLVFNTAAPLTWTQWQPCVYCFKQDQPVFDPSKSSSFKRMRRKHNLASWFNCNVLESSNIIKNHRFNDIIFGCGINNHGRPGPQTAITGLATDSRSVLSFGQEAVLKGENIQTTSFLKLPKTKKLLQGTFKLDLTGISVAGKRLEIPEGSFDGGCGLDSGSPLSVIEEHAYNAVMNAISSYFSQFKNIKRTVNKKYPRNLCYQYPRNFRNFPNMVLHFEGANLEVNETNLFMFGRNLFMSNFVCLQLLGEKKTNLLRVYQQQNFRLLYDLGNEKLLFARDNC
ncbi:Aspartyl protease [Handroanthus impetiginosus]|uniref:Aspartyl protease n=1 Tax=Handroanthus impetiginosus TaxID=429701 RepID=A0A2G9G0T9_9LAMI|nr:Aspartyl protease [Handroanthus impetiginosus]